MATSKGRFGFFGSKSDKTPAASPHGAPAPVSFAASFGAVQESVSLDPSRAYEVKFGGALGGDIVIPAEITAQNVSSQGKAAVRIAGGAPDATPSGRTAGFSVRVPDELEASASGRRVRVEVVARASTGSGDFFTAYSTCDVGNSGWQAHTAGVAAEAHVFEWDVPIMDKGNGDFVGILPAPNSSIEISSIRVEVIARG